MGRIALTSLEFIKPDLSKPLHRTDTAEVKDASGAPKKKPPALKGYQHFQKVIVKVVNLLDFIVLLDN